MKTALEQLESWIEQFYKINGTPTLDDIKGQINLLKDYETEQLAIPRVSGSCPIDAIMHYDKLIKTKLERTFEPLRDHGTHADFCNKINDLREEAKSNYR